MRELSFSVAADQRQSRVPAAVSVALHVANVTIAVIPPPLASWPKVFTPTHSSVMPIVILPKGALPPATAEIRTLVPEPPKVIVGSLDGVREPVQSNVGEVQVGALERSSGEARTSLGYSGLGEVVIGTLAGTPNGKQPEPVGIVGLTGVFTPSGPSREQTVQTAGDEPARVLSVPAASYTDEARRLNVTGEVLLEAKLTASGHVQVLRVLSGLGHGLDQAAITAVNQIRCRPSLKAGRPVDVIAEIRVVFKLT